MSDDGSEGWKKRASAYLQRIGDTYLLDSVKGLYRPRADSDEAPVSEVEKRTPGFWRLFNRYVPLSISFLALLVAKRTVDVMKEGEPRAWIKIETEKIELAKPLSFYLLGDFGGPGPKDYGMPHPEGTYPDSYPGIGMETESFHLDLQNYGSSPAQQAVVRAR